MATDIKLMVSNVNFMATIATIIANSLKIMATRVTKVVEVML